MTKKNKLRVKSMPGTFCVGDFYAYREGLSLHVLKLVKYNHATKTFNTFEFTFKYRCKRFCDMSENIRGVAKMTVRLMSTHDTFHVATVEEIDRWKLACTDAINDLKKRMGHLMECFSTSCLPPRRRHAMPGSSGV